MSEINKNEKGQIVLSPEGILEDLNQGLSRDEIQEKYGLTKTDLQRMFQHPDLKGKKTKKMPGFVWASSESSTTTVEETEDVIAEEQSEEILDEAPQVTDNAFS